MCILMQLQQWLTGHTAAVSQELHPQHPLSLLKDPTPEPVWKYTFHRAQLPEFSFLGPNHHRWASSGVQGRASMSFLSSPCPFSSPHCPCGSRLPWCVTVQGWNSSTHREEFAASWTNAWHTETTNPSSSSTRAQPLPLCSSCRKHHNYWPCTWSPSSCSQDKTERSPFPAGLSSALIAVGFKTQHRWQSWWQPWFGRELLKALKQQPAQSTKSGTLIALLRQHNKPSLGSTSVKRCFSSSAAAKGCAALPCCSQLPASEQPEQEWKLSRLRCHLI